MLDPEYLRWWCQADAARRGFRAARIRASHSQASRRLPSEGGLAAIGRARSYARADRQWAAPDVPGRGRSASNPATGTPRFTGARAVAPDGAATDAQDIATAKCVAAPPPFEPNGSGSISF